MDGRIVLRRCTHVEMTLLDAALKRASTIGAVVVGGFTAMATGLLRNESGLSIPETQRYGHPLVWRITNLNGPSDYLLSPLALDVAFWVTLSVIACFVLKRLGMKGEIAVPYRTLVLPLVLLIPFGLAMCLIHEVGHGLWGTLAGGRLLYIQVAYVIIDPYGIRCSPHFQLGAAAVDGLTYGSSGYGLMLLGGSMMTSIAAWVLGLVLLKINVSSRTQVALKVFSLWGILDLPFYVVFPQMGLGHWIVFGGRGPEPLTGARMMGVPDAVFYLVVVLSTIGLVVLHFRPVWNRVVNETKRILGCLRAPRLHRALVGSLLCGVLITVFTGGIWNPPDASTIGATYYGHPLVWRVVLSTITRSTEYDFLNFTMDTLFWMIVAFATWFVWRKIAVPHRQTSKSPA